MTSPSGDMRAAANTAALIVSAVCERYRVTEDDLRSEKRFALVTRARWVISYLLTEHCGWGQVRIGELLNKHHTSIHHGLHAARKLYRTNRKFFETIQKLEKML